MKPEITTKYLNLPAVPDLHRWIYNRKNPLCFILYAIDKLENIATQLLNKIFRINEVWCGGWFSRFAYSLLSRRVQMLMQRYLSGKPLNNKSLLARHILSLASIDALIVLGGGYINSWHVKARSYLFATTFDVAAGLGKPLFGTGMNIGPLNAYDTRRLSRTFRQFDLIGMRDRHESFEALQQMGIFDPKKHMFSSDDAITLEALSLGDEKLESLASRLSSYIAVQIHLWKMNYSDYELLLQNIAEMIDSIVEHTGLSVLTIPMNFSSDSANSDHKVLKRMTARCKHVDSIYNASDNLDPRQLKFLFAHAKAAVVTRHHSMVFALSENVPCIAIVLDDYYLMKLRGVSEDYGDLCTLVPANQVTSKVLIEHLETYIAKSS